MGVLPYAILGVFLLLGDVSAHAGTETFYENASGSPLIPLIQSAKQSLDIEIYEMNDPMVHDSLKAAIDRGVSIRVIQEERPVGASCKVFQAPSAKDNDSCKAQKNLLQYLRSKGGTYVPFAAQQLCGRVGSRCYQHGKMVIADSHSIMISTGNFNITSLCNKKESPSNCNRDYSMVSTDATVVKTLQTIFEKDLKGKTYDVSEVVNASGTQKLTVSPDSMEPLVDFIRSAKKTIQIQNQYLKDPTLNDAIIEAANRGVQVYIMVASACSYGYPSANDAAHWEQIYGAFDKANVKTRIFTRSITINNASGYLHAKTILVDGARAWVGSVNGSTTSLSNNREYGLFFDDPAEIKKLAAFLANDFADPHGESWRDSLVCKYDVVPTDSGGDDIR